MLQQAQSTGTKILNYASLNFENKRPPTHPVGFRSQPLGPLLPYALFRKWLASEPTNTLASSAPQENGVDAPWPTASGKWQ